MAQLKEDDVQDPIDFYEKHKNATIIIVNTETGLPYKAIYEYCNGIKRKYPAEYFYPEY